MSDLLQLSKREDDSAIFHKMRKQLLSVEREAQSTTSLPPSHSVAYLLRKTNNEIRGSENTKVLKQHKDSL